MREAHGHRRGETQRLAQDAFDVGKVGPVGKGWEAIVAYNVVDLSLCLLQDLRVLDQGEEEVRDRRYSLG